MPVALGYECMPVVLGYECMLVALGYECMPVVLGYECLPVVLGYGNPGNGGADLEFHQSEGVGWHLGWHSNRDGRHLGCWWDWDESRHLGCHQNVTAWHLECWWDWAKCCCCLAWHWGCCASRPKVLPFFQCCL